MTCPCPTCQKRVHWLPTADDLARYVLRTTAAVGLLTLGVAIGGSWMARTALDARQDSLDALAATQACSALVDEATVLVLDAALLARTVGRPRAEPWVPIVYTADLVPSVVRATPP